MLWAIGEVIKWAIYGLSEVVNLQVYIALIL